MSAKQNLSLPRLPDLTLICRCLGFAVLLVSSVARADTLEDAAHELALKVCKGAHPQMAVISWRGFLATAGSRAEGIKKSFLEQVSACGIRLVQGVAAPAMQVSADTTASRVLMVVAWTDEAGGQEVRMVAIPRSTLPSARESAKGPHLESEMVWQQEKPIESAAMQQDSASLARFLYLLSDGRFIRMRFEDGSWKLVDSTELPARQQSSRLDDERFVFSVSQESLEILLGQRTCEIALGDNVSLTCAASKEVVPVPQITSKCESTPRFFATGNGDFTQPDRIILRGPATDKAVPSTDEDDSGFLEMPGPVLNVSTSEDNTAAFAVVRNLATGNYEVYRITSVCNN